MFDGLRKSAATLRTADEFKHWARLHLRPVFPHAAAIFGLGYLHAGGVGLDYLLLVDFPATHLGAIRNPGGVIDTPILRRWLTTQEPQYFDADAPWPETPPQWLASFRRHDLRNVIAHAQYDHGRCIGTYHSFYRLPHPPDARDLETLRSLVPLLHQVLVRVIGRFDADGRVGNGEDELSEREQAVLHGVKRGMTNAEIARSTRLSENTVKHYLTRIFNRFGGANRAQLTLALMAQEARRPPTARTNVL